MAGHAGRSGAHIAGRLNKENTVRRNHFATVAWIGMVTTLVLAQTRPDFSGTWQMDVERTRAYNQQGPRSGGGGTMSAVGERAATAGSADVTTVKIIQTPTALTVERIAGQVWPKVEHRLDGAKSVSVNGRTTITMVSKWDGTRLVSEGTSTTEFSDGSGSVGGSVKEVRWIEPDGVMVVESTRVVTPPPGVQISNPGTPRVSRQYFVKQ
jgi:hypothetical protein